MAPAMDITLAPVAPSGIFARAAPIRTILDRRTHGAHRGFCSCGHHPTVLDPGLTAVIDIVARVALLRTILDHTHGAIEVSAHVAVFKPSSIIPVAPIDIFARASGASAWLF